MAADNYIKLDPTKYRGAQVLALHDALLTCFNLANELQNAMAESVADDGTFAALAVLLGIVGTNANADAQAVHDIVGTMNTNLTGTSNFLQARDRFNRNS